MVKFVFERFYLFAILMFCILLLTYPATFSKDVLSGLALWGQNILPTLLPFVLFSKLILATKTTSVKTFSIGIKFKFDTLLFRVYVNSLICGYPIGAKCTSQLFFKRKIDSATAFNLSLLCSNASPIYLIATISNSFLGGFGTPILLCSHYLSAIVNWLIFRKKSNGVFCTFPTKENPPIDTMTDTIFTVLNVGGYVAVFYMISQMICFVFSLDPANPFVAFFMGLLEMTNGANLLSKCLDTKVVAPLIAGLVSFGGLCVFFQTLPFIKQCKIKTAPYVIAKITQGAIATILCWLFSLVTF